MFATLVTMWMIVIGLIIAILFVWSNETFVAKTMNLIPYAYPYVYAYPSAAGYLQQHQSLSNEDEDAKLEQSETGDIITHDAAKLSQDTILSGVPDLYLSEDKNEPKEELKSDLDLDLDLDEDSVVLPDVEFGQAIHLVVCNVELKNEDALQYSKPVTLFELLLSKSDPNIEFNSDIAVLIHTFLTTIAHLALGVSADRISTHQETFPTVYTLIVDNINYQSPYSAAEKHTGFVNNPDTFNSNIKLAINRLKAKCIIMTKSNPRLFDGEMRETVVGFINDDTQLTQLKPLNFEHIIRQFDTKLPPQSIQLAQKSINGMIMEIVQQNSLAGVYYFTDPVAYTLIGNIFQAYWNNTDLNLNTPTDKDIVDWFWTLKDTWFRSFG